MEEIIYMLYIFCLKMQLEDELEYIMSSEFSAQLSNIYKMFYVNISHGIYGLRSYTSIIINLLLIT